MLLQKALSTLYPDQCVSCGAMVEGAHALCGSCWTATPFIDGLVCDACGVPLLGDKADDADAERPHCDDCMVRPPLWDRGRAAFLYRDNARRMILRLKHGDRIDLARPCGGWLAPLVRELLPPDGVLVPVPLHWTRMVLRRFNQAALLAKAAARETGHMAVPDALLRLKRTPSQENRTREERMVNVGGAMAINPPRAQSIEGRDVLVIDDVMTSGATLTEATRVLREEGASQVSVLALARVAKEA